MRLRRIVVVSAFAIGLAYSQNVAAPSPEFEVASVKPAAQNRGGRKTIDLQEVRYSGFHLRDLLRDAYQVKRYQINGPAWIDTERYDVVAKLPEGTARTQIPAMLQSLLAERFQMKVHREIRQDRVYTLVVAKGGPHLTASADQSDRPPELEGQDGKMEFAFATLDSFTTDLSNFLDTPVLDMTGLRGHFDITLNIDSGTPNTIPDTNFSSSILSAVQTLGLKLESRTAPLQHIVVDSAEKIPTRN